MSASKATNLMIDAMKNGEVGFYYDYKRNRPTLAFTIEDGTILYLCSPRENGVINPVTFELSYTSFVATSDRDWYSISSNDYNKIITLVEDKIGISINELTFNTMNYFDKRL